MDSFLQKLIELAMQNPDYRGLDSYLKQRGVAPTVSREYLPQGTSAMFEYGSDIQPSGKITLNSMYANPGLGASSLLHETTHAGQRQMGEQFVELSRKERDSKLSNEERQFLENYRKLNFRQKSAFPEGMLTGNRREWNDSNIGYRSSITEAPAFAVQNANREYSTSSRTMQPAPLHMDPTKAQEFMILLDQARRAGKPVTNSNKLAGLAYK